MDSEIKKPLGSNFRRRDPASAKTSPVSDDVLNCYSTHIQFPFLTFMQETRVLVIALPAHTSHELQPLDVAAFGTYKSYLPQ